jgi:hypothetical protein
MENASTLRLVWVVQINPIHEVNKEYKDHDKHHVQYPIEDLYDGSRNKTSVRDGSLELLFCGMHKIPIQSQISKYL